MTDMITGWVHFLTVAPEVDKGDIALVCFVRGLIDASPTVVIERLLNGRVDTAHGHIEVLEITEDDKEKPASAAAGKITVVPKQGGTIRGGARVWEFLVRTAPGGQGPVTFRLSAGLLPGIPMKVLAESKPVTVQSSMLNTDQPVPIGLLSPKVPRLSVAINKATPATAPDNYRGYYKGSGDPNKLPKDRQTEHVASLLHQLFFQLDAPYTLDPAWDQAAGMDSWTQLSKSAFSVSPIAVAEERWARQVSEMTLLTAYAAPSMLYGGGTFSDYKMSAKVFFGPEPHYSLGYHCQELATFGVASRGVQLKNVLLAGSNAAALVISATPAGKWYVDEANPVASPTAKSGRPHDSMDGPHDMNLLPLLKAVPDYGPGSVHLFSNHRPPPDGPLKGTKPYDELLALFEAGTPVEGSATKVGEAFHPVRKAIGPAQLHIAITRDAKKSKPGAPAFAKTITPMFLTPDKLYTEDCQPFSAHIGFAVRVRHDLNKVQFIDTGALKVADSLTDIVVQGGFQESIYDTAGTTRVSNSGEPYKGTGIFPPTDVAGATQLIDVVSKLTKARPLGLARFALVDRLKMDKVTSRNIHTVVQPDGALIYASALLPMWGADENQNYHISRFLWSLRNMPNAAQLQAVWMLYVPQNKFAIELSTAARTENLMDVAHRAVTSADFARGLATLTNPLQDLVVSTDGKVKTLASKGADTAPKHLLHALEGRSTTGGKAVLLPLDQPFPPLNSAFMHSLLPEYFRA